MRLGLMPQLIARPTLIIGLTAGALAPSFSAARAGVREVEASPLLSSPAKAGDPVIAFAD
jgi:hypothetical protein